MDKFVCILILLIMVALIGAGSTARKSLSWENGYLVYNNEIQADPFNKEKLKILNFRLRKLEDTKDNIFVKLNDNSTTRSFISELPMNLTFQAYGDTEFISYLDSKLIKDISSEGYAPMRGDFCYYSPWGNVVFFTQDAPFIQGLVKIGEIQEGQQFLAQLDNAQDITVKLID